MPIRYNTRPVILGEYVTSWNGRTGAVVPMAGDYDACMIEYTATILGQPVEWVCEALDLFNTKINDEMLYSRGDSAWDGGEYPPWYIAQDDGWLMKSNKTTTDRPAPQPIGNAEFILPDVPAFLTNTFSGVVHSGFDINFDEGGWIKEVRVWVPFLSTETNYRIIVADITDPANPLARVIEEPVLNEDGWTTITLVSKAIKSGTKYRIFVDALTSSDNTFVSGGWASGGDKDVPATGEWSHDKDKELFINNVDLDAVDRSSELMGIIIGSTIRFSLTANPNIYKEYNVTSAPIQRGSFVDYDVTLEDEEGNLDNEIGEPTSMLATIPIPQPTEYVEIVGYFPSGQPSWGTVTGYLSLNGVEQNVPANAYGVDIQYQRATVSEDWDYLSYTEFSTTDPSEAAKMPVAPDGQYSVAINNEWVNSAQISGVPVYTYSEIGVITGGLIQTNNSDLGLVTEIYVSKNALSGADFSAVFEKISPDTVIALADYLDNTNYGVYDVTGQAVAAGNTFTIPVTVRDHNGALTVSELTTLSIVPFSEQTTVPKTTISIVASGRNPNNNDYLGFGATIQGGTANYCIPLTGIIRLATIGRTDSDDSNVEILVNNAVVETLFTTNQQTVYDPLNIPVIVGDKLELRVDGNRISNAVVTMLLEST